MTGVRESPAKRRCTMLVPENVTSLGETGIEKEDFTFIWTVKDYSALSEMLLIKSPIFEGGPINKHKWQLVLFPKKIFEDNEYLGIFLQIVGRDESNSADSTVKATAELSLLNSDGETVLVYRLCGNSGSNSPIQLTKGVNMRGTYRFIWTSYVHNPANKILVNDTFKIRCKINIIGEIKGKVITGGTARCSPPPEERHKKKMDKMVSEFGKLFTESILTDLTVKVGDTSFKAHKAILIVRSPVFATMFNNDTVEKRESILKIPDFDAEIVKGMLDYVYTGHTDAMAERATDLLQISEKYELFALKEECEYAIAGNLNFENAVVILVLADSYNASYLKKRTIEFINMNNEELMKQKGFQNEMKVYANTGAFADLYLSQS